MEHFKEICHKSVLDGFLTTYHKSSNFLLRKKAFGKTKYLSNINISEMLSAGSRCCEVVHCGNVSSWIFVIDRYIWLKFVLWFHSNGHVLYKEQLHLKETSYSLNIWRNPNYIIFPYLWPITMLITMLICREFNHNQIQGNSIALSKAYRLANYIRTDSMEQFMSSLPYLNMNYILYSWTEFWSSKVRIPYQQQETVLQPQCILDNDHRT